MKSKTPKTISARHALTHEGWKENVTVYVSESDGTIEKIHAGIEVPGAHGILLAGMPNLHSHAFQRAMAGLTEKRGENANDSFWTWRTQMYRFVEKLTPKHAQAIARWLYIEMLKSGYTRVGEFNYLHQQPDGTAYEYPTMFSLACLQAAYETGINMTLLPVLYQHSDFGGKTANPGQRRFLHGVESYLKLLEQLQPHVKAQKATLGIAPHSLRAVTPDMLHEVLGALPGLGMQDCPKHIHIAEQLKEVESCMAWSGKRPVEWLLDNVPVDESWCLVHATHMTDTEMRELARSGAVAGLCPTTEGNLGDGIFPARSYVAQKGRWGIGSDSHISVNAAEELRLLEYGQRLLHQSRAMLSSRESCGRTLWEGAVAGGNQALGAPQNDISTGQPADIIALSLDSPLFAGKSGDDLLDTAIFGLPILPVSDVYVGGKHVVENGQHPWDERAKKAYVKAMEELA